MSKEFDEANVGRLDKTKQKPNRTRNPTKKLLIMDPAML